ncbi:MAG TPA: SurA N-terminal domain-containing protein [Candidatus Acidoferrum sp.]|nr:SurA N-terminal domain-containing protein [Candidatus Acidoferrum sp.]
MATLRAQFFYMFGTIRRHQKWLLFVIVAAVIASMLLFLNPSEQDLFEGGRGGSQLGVIDGHRVTKQEFQDAAQEARLRYFSNYRKFPEDDDQASQRGFDLNREATVRLVLLAKVEEAGIKVADVTVGELANRMLGGANRIAEFETQVLKVARPPLTVNDFERWLRNDIGIQQLSALHGAAGRMVTPAEAEEIYRRENQEVVAQLAIFNVSNYLSRITVTNNVLTQWYSNQMARYRTPEQVVVSYVRFAQSNFLAEADKFLEGITNLNQRIEETYNKQGTNSFTDTNGVVLSREAAFAKIKEEGRDQRAMMLAMQQANEFGNKLDEVLNAAKQPTADLLNQVASSNKLTVHVTQPFDAEEGPTNLNVTPNFARAAFSLTPTNAVMPQPIPGEDAFYIIALKETISSRPQSFAEVKDKVTSDYKQAQAFGLMRTEAMDFQNRVTNGLATGKTFDELASAAKVNVITLPPISRSTESLTNLQDVVDTRQLKNVVLSLEPGKAGPFQISPPTGGFIVYVKQRVPIDEAKMKEGLPKFLGEIRYMRQNQLFSQWFNKELEKAAPGLPLLTKPQQQPRRG